MLATRAARLKVGMFVLTFIVYAAYHASRKPPSIVKSVLHPTAASGESAYNAETNPGWAPFNQDLVPEVVSQAGFVVSKCGQLEAVGDYKCEKKVKEGDICYSYANEYDYRLVYNPKYRGTYHHCWELLGPEREILYYQNTKERHCTALPRLDTDGESNWKINGTAGGKSPSPAMAPAVTSGTVLLGILDSVYLVFYAVGMFITGPLGDRLNLTYFLGAGMLATGAFVSMIGFSRPLGIHAFGYFVAMYAIQGFFQSTGWPCVVAVMGSWYGHKTRGLAMGVWNAHTSVGNILGSVLSVAALSFGMYGADWPAAFLLLGGVIAAVGVAVFVCLVPHPHDVGLPSPDEEHSEEVGSQDEEAMMLANAGTRSNSIEGDGGNLATGTRSNGKSAIPPSTSNVSITTNTTNTTKSSHSGDESDSSEMGVSLLAAAVNGKRMSFGAVESGPPARSFSVSPTDELNNQNNNNASADGNHGNGTESADVITLPTYWDRFWQLSFIRALLIPGVIQYALCLFFAKLVAYTFLFWLPLYLTSLSFSVSQAGLLSTFFDVGGIVGGALAGWMSDKLGSRSIIAFGYLMVAVPTLYFYRVITFAVGSEALVLNIVLMLACGAVVNGPYALITTAVAADLGTHESLKGDSKLLATVAGIIDGTGSLGAAVQGVLISFLSGSWTTVFYALITCCILSALLIVRLVVRDVKKMCGARSASVGVVEEVRI